MTRENYMKRWIIPALERTWNDSKCEEIIEFLEQQTCEDAISRQAVLDIFADNADATRPYNTAWEKIRDLPSVNPQPKVGRWIYTGDYLTEGMLKCSECGEEIDVSESYYDFCPVCGAKMVEPQESEVTK